jgi:hypothetical protein
MEPRELVTNKLLVWVSPLSFISKWLLKERNGTESNGTKRLGYKQITCLGISFISKWNRTDLNWTERKATCFYPYLPPSLYLFLGFPFHSASLRFVIPDNDIEILSHFIPLSPSRSVIPDNDIEILSHFVPLRSVIHVLAERAFIPTCLSCLPTYLPSFAFLSVPLRYSR